MWNPHLLLDYSLIYEKFVNCTLLGNVISIFFRCIEIEAHTYTSVWQQMDYQIISENIYWLVLRWRLCWCNLELRGAINPHHLLHSFANGWFFRKGVRNLRIFLSNVFPTSFYAWIITVTAIKALSSNGIDKQDGRGRKRHVREAPKVKGKRGRARRFMEIQEGG